LWPPKIGNILFMNPAIRTLGLLVSFLFLLSCHKSSDSDPNSNGSILSKVTIYTEFPYLYTDVYEFQYDSLNRVTKIIHSSGSSSNKLTIERTQQCFYKTGEMWPYKSVGFNPNEPNAEIYYTYDTRGRVISDSCFSQFFYGYTLHKYDWYNDNVITNTTINSNLNITPPPIQYTVDSAAISNNNITAQYRTNRITRVPEYGSSMSYDDKVNPINTLNIHAITDLASTGELPTFGYSKNNVTISDDKYVGFTGQYTYKYQYNAAGLPIYCQQTGTGASQFTKETNYTYTN